MKKLPKKRKDADLFSDIENTEKIKQTRTQRHKIILSSDNFNDDSDDSPPPEITKAHSPFTMYYAAVTRF